jgi:hypothetical protein
MQGAFKNGTGTASSPLFLEVILWERAVPTPVRTGTCRHWVDDGPRGGNSVSASRS